MNDVLELLQAEPWINEECFSSGGDRLQQTRVGQRIFRLQQDVGRLVLPGLGLVEDAEDGSTERGELDRFDRLSRDTKSCRTKYDETCRTLTVGHDPLASPPPRPSSIRSLSR